MEMIPVITCLGLVSCDDVAWDSGENWVVILQMGLHGETVVMIGRCR